MIRRWLLALAHWILAYYAPDAVVVARVDALVAEADRQWPAESGEFRRHQVYARLKKDYPWVSELGLLIEQSVVRRRA